MACNSLDHSRLIQHHNIPQDWGLPLDSELGSLSFTGNSLSDTLLLAEAVFLEGVADGVSDEGLLGVAGVGEGSRTFLGLGWGGAAED